MRKGFAACAVFLAYLFSAGAHAQLQYRFLEGPHQDGATNPGACTDANEPWYATPAAACAGLPPVLESCARSTATYRNFVPTLIIQTTCSVTYEFLNTNEFVWQPWTTSRVVSTKGCPTGYKEYPANSSSCVVIKEVNDNEKSSLGCPAAKVAAAAESGNPINALTGAKKDHLSTGISLGGVELSLVYDTTSKIPAQGDLPTSFVQPNAFGVLWRSSFHHKLQVAANRKSALLSRGDGRIINFAGDGSGTFTAASDNPHKLVSITGGYRFTDSFTGTLETFDAAGKLTSLATVGGAVLTFTYSADDLTAVQANDGRVVRFAYANGLITQIGAPDFGTIVPAYDANNNLVSLTWQDGKVFGLLYENAQFPWALTGKMDENNSRLSTYAYDSAGRAISTEYANGLQKFAVSWASPPVRVVTDEFDATNNVINRTHSWISPSGTSVTQPNGQSVGIEAQLVAGMPQISSQSQPAGSGCTASTSNVAWDASGNVLSRNDFLGYRTCYAYDSGNREIVRVEGLAAGVDCSTVTPTNATLPTGARKVATTWHPDWRLPALVAEPLRKTTTVYHGQSDPFNGGATANCTSAAARADGKPLALVCKRVEQATLGNGNVDTAVAARANSFTYDSLGQVLSSVDPNGKTTTFAYYTNTAFGDNFDPHIGSVTLLLHGNGANGSTTIVDNGPNGKSPTATGNASISTGQSKFGGSSIAFDGAGDYVLIPYSTDFAFGAGDFTIETFLYKNANNANTSRIWNPNGDLKDGVSLSIDGSGNFAVYLSTDGTNWTQSQPVVANLANGQWYHLAVTRSGGSVFAFVNGVKYVVTATLGTAAMSTNTAAGRVIGGQAGADRALNGYVDEFRITKGVARYTSNFTPPTQEFSHSVPTLASTGHTIGDLQTVTNPAGHATQFNLYDLAGRVRQMTDPKGVVTDVTYDGRGRVGTITATPPGGTARTTTYTYDDVGQLTGVALPDGTSLIYSYDAAHRLTGATDARGNSVTYTLDNVGNRIAEEVRDPSNVLQRSISRSFDALNRLQQVTGAAN